MGSYNSKNRYNNLDTITRINSVHRPIDLRFDDALYVIDNQHLFNEKFVNAVKKMLRNAKASMVEKMSDISGVV